MTKAAAILAPDFEVHEGSELIMRLGIGLTVFLPTPFEDVRQDIWQLWQKYVDMVGKDTFTWARLGGGNRSRNVNASVFKTIEAWLTGTKSYGKDCWISINDGPMDCLGRNSFELEGLRKSTGTNQKSGHLDIGFPLNLLQERGGPALADALVSLVEDTRFLCGTAGFIFHRSPYKFNATIGKMAALSRRFEGVEVTASAREHYWAQKGLVTVNWITLLGSQLVDQSGGVEKLSKQLASGVRVISLEHGLAIQSGKEPLLGDRNSGKDELGLLRKTYRVLKPLQFVDPVYEFDPFEFDGERTAEWLQRLSP